MEPTTTEAAPVIAKKEANFLNKIADAARDYRNAMELVRRRVDLELDLMKHGQRVSGIGSQALVEIATKQEKLETLLNLSRYVKEMDDVDAWDNLVTLAYTGQVDWFEATK